MDAGAFCEQNCKRIAHRLEVSDNPALRICGERNQKREGKICKEFLHKLKSLHVVKFLVIAVKCQQLFVAASFYDASFVHYADLVSVLDG